MFSIGRAGLRRGGFELVVVFLGVFVALLVDGWNEGRIERGLERDYLARVSVDAEEDRAELASLGEALERKRFAIELLLSDGGALSGLSDEQILYALVEASTAGFGVLSGNSTTFEDLRSTGNLGLVSDPALRARIVSYYEQWRFNAERVEARRSTFPSDVYSLLPEGAYSTDVFFDAPSGSVPATFDRSAALDFVRSERGQSGLRAEANYARFFRGVVRDLDQRASALLAALGGGEA